MNWIKCSERMPEPQEEVLFYVPPGQEYCSECGVFCGSRYVHADGEGSWSVAYDMYEGSNWRDKYVTHWVPLPEPPQ